MHILNVKKNKGMPALAKLSLVMPALARPSSDVPFLVESLLVHRTLPRPSMIESGVETRFVELQGKVPKKEKAVDGVAEKMKQFRH